MVFRAVNPPEEDEYDPVTTTMPTNSGNARVTVAAPTLLLEPGVEPPEAARLLLHNHPTADGPAAELRSPGDVALTPAAGSAVRTTAPAFVGALTAAGALGGASLENVRMHPGALLLTDAAGYARFNFPVPFPVECWGGAVGAAGEFSYSFGVGLYNFDRFGVTIRAGREATGPFNAAGIAVWLVMYGR